MAPNLFFPRGCAADHGLLPVALLLGRIGFYCSYWLLFGLVKLVSDVYGIFENTSKDFLLLILDCFVVSSFNVYLDKLFFMISDKFYGFVPEI